MTLVLTSATLLATASVAALAGKRHVGEHDCRWQSKLDRYCSQGAASCYVEFGEDGVGRVDVDFLSGPKPTGSFRAPSAALTAGKVEFGKIRRARWFGLSG